MLKQGLELKQTQKLSPLQIQTIKLIELPIQELEQRVKAELEENPVLDDSPAPDRDDDSDDPKDVSIDEIDENDPIPSYKLRATITERTSVPSTTHSLSRKVSPRA